MYSDHYQTHNLKKNPTSTDKKSQGLGGSLVDKARAIQI